MGAGGDHHSLLPRGPGSSLVFTSMKSECPAYARGGGGVRGFQMTGALIGYQMITFDRRPRRMIAFLKIFRQITLVGCNIFKKFGHFLFG